MKKYIYFAFMAVALSFGMGSCSVETDEEPGGTNVQKMAGRWDVTVDVVDANGNVLAKDPYGIGTFTMMTYNTATNAVDSMWITDSKVFWAFAMKVGVNYDARTFSCAETDYDAAGTGKAIVTDGKILEGAALNLHGKANDSIVFNITFSDDNPAHGTIYRLSGQRYTGFYE